MRRPLALVGTAVLAAGFALIGAPAAQATASTGWLASLAPVSANRSTGSGIGWITLTGDTAEFTVQVTGLANGIHPAQIHVDGMGSCPTTPSTNNGYRSITATAGASSYGSIGASLTTVGDTSWNSALAMDRYPSGSAYTYKRTFTLSDDVVTNLQRGTAVLVIHGIDYNHNGRYDDVLGISDLKATLPAEATDPALCAAFVPAQMPAVPHGAANTGGGGGSSAAPAVEAGLGVAALLAAASIGWLGRRRRQTT